MTILQAIRNNSLLLLAFALAAAGILAITYESTREHIALAERAAAEKALLEIIPAERIDNDLLLDTLTLAAEDWAQLGLQNGGEIHLARRQQQIIAVIIHTVAPEGYSGEIKLLAGVHREGTIAGVRTLSHRETPGLGDKIDLKKSPWITSFNGKSLRNPNASGWRVKKDGGDFDQFTGATITPRAVVNQVYKVLQFVDAHHAKLFAGNEE
ncbi:MAG: electron transport complex subunit RsxG [Cellvibrionaceae bacterium]|nr:electron transport complex subunit RsxG [Cellvibrionaceae bacterium]